MIKRTMEIREVQNGFVVTTTLDRERTNPSDVFPYVRKELVVDSLVKLIKAIKAFFGSEIVEEQA